MRSVGWISPILASALLVLPMGRSFGRQATPGATKGLDRRPNIVLILADDLGYGDIAAYGCKDIPTPNIDALAESGVRFTSGYVSCPVCSPTRAGLLTGRYQTRFGHEYNPGRENVVDQNFGLPLSQKTLAERLKAVGYATGAIGKWHLGFKPEFQPLARGFDEFFGFLGGSHPYLVPRGKPGVPATPHRLQRGTEEVEERGYLTDVFSREAGTFIERHQRGPFFLYLPFSAVHGPVEAPRRYQQRFQHMTNLKHRTYAAAVSALDDAVGKVLEKLVECDLDQKTIVIFLSDNGASLRQTGSNKPFSGTKGSLLEGGIRIPFLIRWAGTLPAGTVYQEPVISLDIHPTVLAAARAPASQAAKLDGVNLLPFILGQKKEPPHERLFWRFGEQSAARDGEWKLLDGGLGQPKLFNLRSDPREKKSLAPAEPERLKRMQADYSAWNKQNASPAWLRGEEEDEPKKPQKR